MNWDNKLYMQGVSDATRAIMNGNVTNPKKVVKMRERICSSGAKGSEYSCGALMMLRLTGYAKTPEIVVPKALDSSTPARADKMIKGK